MIFHCFLDDTRPLFRVLNQMIQVNNLTFCISKIHPNITVPSKPRFIQWFFPSRSKICKNYLPSHACCFTRPYNISWFRHLNNTYAWGEEGSVWICVNKLVMGWKHLSSLLTPWITNISFFLLLLPFQACWFSVSNVISFIIKFCLMSYFTLLSLWSWGLDCTSVYLKFLRFTNFLTVLCSSQQVLFL
jgi:hypothetical protein